MTSAPPMTNTSLPPAASGRWVTMKNGMPNGFRPLHASAASYVFRRGTPGGSRRLARRLLLVAPGAAEDPVVQPLASLPESAARPVVSRFIGGTRPRE